MKLVLGSLLRSGIAYHVAEPAKPAVVVTQGCDDDIGPEPQAVAPHAPSGLREASGGARDLEVTLGLACLDRLGDVQAGDAITAHLIPGGARGPVGTCVAAPGRARRGG